MNIVDFLGIGVVGAALSFLIQFIKSRFSYSPLKIKGLTILLSIVVGGIYYWLRSTVWYETIIGVLVAATTVWAFFLREE